jgi:hypothetical protein
MASQENANEAKVENDGNAKWTNAFPDQAEPGTPTFESKNETATHDQEANAQKAGDDANTNVAGGSIDGVPNYVRFPNRTLAGLTFYFDHQMVVHNDNTRTYYVCTPNEKGSEWSFVRGEPRPDGIINHFAYLAWWMAPEERRAQAEPVPAHAEALTLESFETLLNQDNPPELRCPPALADQVRAVGSTPAVQVSRPGHSGDWRPGHDRLCRTLGP